ncbi:MAG TPA: response regulator [Leptospiraceae bacterium]|nr:response regulator [Leptospiraceae bacterium]
MAESENDILTRRESIVVTVDDDPAILDLIRHYLGHAGLQPVTFNNAEEALQHLPDLHPDCILLDFSLPGMSGIQTCMKIREHASMRETPIIFLSADEDKKRVVQALTAGANDYITKPVHEQELIVRIETHIELYLQKQRMLEQRRLLERRNEENIILNTRSLMLQEVIRQFTPRSTWEKADLAAGEGMIGIADEEIDMTYFFLDIRSFTRFSDTHPAQEVIHSLNEILAPVTDIIYEEGGDVDKFIGDSIFGTFSDPLSAARAAIRSRDAIAKINANRRASGKAELGARIGMNSGRAIRGNVGSTIRKENTLIGDAVNVASRLEHACEPGRVMISAVLYERVRGKVTVSRPYLLKAKGKSEAIRVYYLEAIQ